MILGLRFFERRGKVFRENVCSCDSCGKIFYRKSARSERLHFCSRKCLIGSPLICEQQRKTFQLKYGVNSPNCLESVKSKKAASLIKHYGENVHQILFMKRSKTCHNKYGVENPFQIEEVKKKIKSTLFEHYGVEHALQSKEIKSKMNFREAYKKAHITMKKHGTYAHSKPENAFFKVLCDEFGANDVMQQLSVNCSLIDFYVKSINIYVQFDGVYWHGLDRTVKELNESKSPRDKVILDTKRRDFEQNDFFERNKMTLVRVLEKPLSSSFLPHVGLSVCRLWSLLLWSGLLLRRGLGTETR